MLVVKTEVKSSQTDGLGLFAAEKINKGAPIWVYDSRFDIAFDPEDIEKMPQVQRGLIEKYAYLSPETKKYIYSIDNTRFMNHSSLNSNVAAVPFPNEVETRGVAIRDIEVGEELLINYRLIDSKDANSDDTYLNV